MDNGSLLYVMPGYNAYSSQTFLGVDGKNLHLSSSECTPCYSWNSTYTNDARYQNPTSWGVQSGMISNGSSKSNGVNFRRSMMTTSNERFPNNLLDMQSQSQHSTFNLSHLATESPHLSSLNKVCILLSNILLSSQNDLNNTK